MFYETVFQQSGIWKVPPSATLLAVQAYFKANERVLVPGVPSLAFSWLSDCRDLSAVWIPRKISQLGKGVIPG